MTRDETIKILAILRGAYPNFYRGISKQEAYDTLDLWAAMFAPDDYRLVGAAVKSIIETDEKGFPPTIGQIKCQMRPKEMTEAEAWSLVSKALKNSLYKYKQEFEKLPEAVQRIVGSANRLREWAMMDIETVQSVVASNFKRSFRAEEGVKNILPPGPSFNAALAVETMEKNSTGERNHNV